MEWQQLIYFKYVAETGSMGKASELLHVTQPAISMSIRKMEEDLGVPLFTRHKKSIFLNKYGKAYLKHVYAVLKELDDGEKEISEMLENERNHIHVMFPDFFMTPQFMHYIYKYAPDIIVENHNIDFSTVQRSLIDGTLDMCLFAPPITDKNLITVPVEVQEIVAVTSKNHPLAGLEEISLSELRSERFASYTEDTVPRNLFQALCEENGFTPAVKFQSNTVRDILTPVMAGRAIAVVSRNSLNADDAKVLHIIRLKERPQTVFAITYNKNTEKPHLIDAMRSAVMECYHHPPQQE